MSLAIAESLDQALFNVTVPPKGKGKKVNPINVLPCVGGRADLVSLRYC